MLTVMLGASFTCVQAYEYIHAPFTFGFNHLALVPFTDPAHINLAAGAGNFDAIYGSTFFMATGFHGFHVIVGTIFLTVCLFRAIAGPVHARRAISASKPPPGTGTSSTWCGCSCSACIYVWGQGPSRPLDARPQPSARHAPLCSAAVRAAAKARCSTAIYGRAALQRHAVSTMRSSMPATGRRCSSS